MATSDLLEANSEKLLAQYTSNLQDVLDIQRNLVKDFLPSIVDEFSLSPETAAWCKQWLEDTVTIFRISRRHDFTTSSALESVRKNLIWRLDNLRPLDRSLTIPRFHCLPRIAHDPLGRPIVIIGITSVDEVDVDPKSLILLAFERGRAYLQYLNKKESKPVMQFVILVDLTGLTFAHLNTELLVWGLSEVIPRYPGMLAGVFMVNYSWFHAGMWSIIKHVLPAAALSRVFFPSNHELVRYFGSSMLPNEYGGTLSTMKDLENPLGPEALELEVELFETVEPVKLEMASFGRIFKLTSLSPTSLLNPFFGYPASSDHGSISLEHGRRRKRDLARTLAVLFWARWRGPFILGLVVALCAFALAISRGAERAGLSKSFLAHQPFGLLKLRSA